VWPVNASHLTPSRLRMIIVLGLLSTFGPLSLDLYLPVLPELADELQASASGSQLTITTCLIGLATGQLIAGPLSDRLGRRRPLITGLTIFVLASAACAFAPSVEILILIRLVQGMAGAAGLVVARAVVRDLYAGRDLVIFFSRLLLISGLAPVLAPVLGGQLAKIMSWRGMFLVLAGFGAVLLLAGLLGVPETLPRERRVQGGWSTTVSDFSLLIKDRIFTGSVLAAGLSGASMFSYIAGATFVLQRIHGLSAQQFSVVFATNSLGLIGFGQISARLAQRWTPIRVLGLALTLNFAGAVWVAVAVLINGGFWPLVAGLFLMVSSVGMVFPVASAVALADYPHQAGAASSLFGLAQFTAGAIAAPLVGIAGEASAVPLGIVVVCASSSACIVFAALVRPAVRARERQPTH
jgi:DHA1 family bicyclomycin/chloramphenicol resistance-like MFS transporter